MEFTYDQLVEIRNTAMKLKALLGEIEVPVLDIIIQKSGQLTTQRPKIEWVE